MKLAFLVIAGIFVGMQMVGFLGQRSQSQDPLEETSIETHSPNHGAHSHDKAILLSQDHPHHDYHGSHRHGDHMHKLH